ncbi:tRNA 2-thiocytidine biosynthesis protein TtcA, partial [Helicobacter pylori]
PAKQPTSDKPPIARLATKNFLKEMQNLHPHFFDSLENAFNNVQANSFSDAKYLDA